MLYKQRYLFVIALIIFILSLGFFIDTNALYLAYQKLQFEKKQYLYESLKLATTDLGGRLTQNDVLVDLANLIANSALSLQKLEIETADITAARTPVYFEVQGEMKPILAFINQINSVRYPVLFNTFSYEKRENAWYLKANVALIGLIKKDPSPHAFIANDKTYFCTGNTFSNKTFASLDQFSIHALKMTGYLQQGLHKMALLAMPNAQTMTVKVGDHLGVEHAEVAQIDQDKLTFNLPDHQSFILKI